MRKWSVAAAFVASALMLVTVKGQQADQSQAARGGAYVPDEILVKFSPAVNTIQGGTAIR